MARVPIPDDWDGTTYCCHLIEWPASQQWRAILLGLLTWVGRGRFWDERTGVVTDVQDIGREIFARNILGECEMPCIEDFIDAISVAVSGGGGGCCPPTGAATGSIEPPVITTGDEGSDPPEGYGDGALSENQKCDMANFYWRGLVDYIQALIDYNVLGLLALGVVYAIGAILALLEVVLAAAFFSLTTAQLGTFTDIIQYLIKFDETDLQQIIDALNADQQGFVCALYTSANVGGAQTNLIEWASNAGLGGSGSATNAFLRLVLNEYVLAGLFFPKQSAIDEAAAMAGKVSCEFCEQPVEGLIWFTATETPYNEVEFGQSIDTYLPDGWSNTGEAIADNDGWGDIDNDSEYPFTYFAINNPAYQQYDLDNSPGGQQTYWVTLRIDFTGYDGAWEFAPQGGAWSYSLKANGPGYSSGAFRSGKLTELVSWKEFNWEIDLNSQNLIFSVRHFSDTNTSQVAGRIRELSVTITDDQFP